MNLKNEQHKDAWIDRGAEGLRSVKVPNSVHQVASIRAIAAPLTTVPRRFGLSVGLAAVVVAILMIGMPLMAERANAASIRLISEAQRAQKTRHQRSFVKDESGKLVLLNEIWQDGEKYAMKFFNSDGLLSGWNTFDGFEMHLYSPADPANGRVASAINDDTEPSALPLETLDDYLNIPALQPVSKKINSSFDGTKCDLYIFGRSGYYKVYIDPSTRLPIGRIVSAKGFYEKDYYDYPATIDYKIFGQPDVAGVEFWSYPQMRVNLQAKLKETLQVAEIGGKKVEVKAVVEGDYATAVIWRGTDFSSSYRDFAKANGGLANMKEFTAADGVTYNVGLVYRQGRPITSIKIPVRDASGKLVGNVSVDMTDQLVCPSPERLLWKPEGGEKTAVAVGSSKK